MREYTKLVVEYLKLLSVNDFGHLPTLTYDWATIVKHLVRSKLIILTGIFHDKFNIHIRSIDVNREH